MTLIISEITKYGIVMVADSAVTETYSFPTGKIRRVLNGIMKLQTIPYLSAGISMWGLGSIPPSGVSTDVWIHDFIMRHTGLGTLQAFAETLANELQEQVGNLQDAMGFHLAGYVEVDGKKMPTLYHIRNVDGTFEHYDFHDFIAGHDFPPMKEEQLEEKNFYIRNGDYGKYAYLAAGVDFVLPTILNKAELEIPHPSLEGRIMYHAAWIRFVSDLYASSGLLRTIGGDIDTIGIRPDNQIIIQRF